MEHSVGYEDMPVDKEFYRNKTVLIFGKGSPPAAVARQLRGTHCSVSLNTHARTVSLTHAPLADRALARNPFLWLATSISTSSLHPGSPNPLAANAAFETANHIRDVAASTVIAGARHHIRFAWETHYVGDIRCAFSYVFLYEKAQR